MGSRWDRPRRHPLNFCWQASQTVTSALVSSRRNGRSRQFISVFTMNLAHFLARACLGLPRPAVSQMAPRCLPGGSQMAPRCLPYVSQMSPRCLPAPRCLQDVSQMSARGLPGVSQMSSRCLSDVSKVSLRCLPDVSQMCSRCLSNVFQHWAYLSVEMQDMCLVESQDICFVETQDMCCVETVAKDTTGSQPSPAGRVRRSKK